MKCLVVFLSFFLSVNALCASYHAKVDDVLCGEIDPFIIGDACIIYLTRLEDQKKMAVLFDIDEVWNSLGESIDGFTGKRVLVNPRYFSKIYNPAQIEELRQMDSKYFYLTGLHFSKSISLLQEEKECRNTDEYFEEDSLSIAADKKSVSYFDNDTITEIPCTQLGEILVCANSNQTVKILKSGVAHVINGEIGSKLQSTEFNCQ